MKQTHFFQSKINIIFCIVAILITLILQYQLWFGEAGKIALQQLKEDIIKTSEANQALKDRNKQLYAEMQDLREGLDVVEEYARLDLGLVKKNETFVQINSAKVVELPEEFKEETPKPQANSTSATQP